MANDIYKLLNVAYGGKDTRLDFLREPEQEQSTEDMMAEATAEIDKASDLERAAELKRSELQRKGELQYEENGSLIHDSNTMIRAKEAANAGIRGVDWLLEASENIADFSQGDLIDYKTGFQAENQGKRYSMQNKDFIAARDTDTNQLISQYQNAQHDPNSDKGIYTLKKFDGFNLDGSRKYIYKYGLAEVGADARYREQWVEDGFEIVEEKRFAGAEQWEKTWNASQGVLDARVLDSDKITVDGEEVSRDVASGINFGAGKSELLDKDLLGTDVGKTQTDYDENRVYSERLSKAADARWQSGMDDSIVDAFQSGAAKTVVDTADFILDVITPWGDNTLLNDAKKQENIDKFVGYDRTQSTQALSDAATYWNQGNYFDAISTVITDPNTMVESIPMMIGMMAGSGKFTAATKLMKGVATAEKAGKSVATIDKMKKGVELSLRAEGPKGVKAWESYQKWQDAPAVMKTFDHFARNAGFHTIVGAMTNNVLDDRIASKIEAGEEGSVDMMEALGVYALQLPLLAIDRMSFKAILGIGTEGKALKKAFDMVDSAGKKSIIAKIGIKAGEIAVASGAEGAQEYVQTWGEILGANLGVGSDGELMQVLGDDENRREALMGGLGGLGAGAQMSAGANAIPSSIRGVKDAYDYATATKGERAVKKATKVSDFKNTDISQDDVRIELMNSMMPIDKEADPKLKDFDIKTAKSFNEMIDILVSKRTNDPKSEGAKAIKKQETIALVMSMINQAEKIQKANGDTSYTKDVIDKLLVLDKDPDFDFKLSDIESEGTDSIMDSFFDIMNQDVSTTLDDTNIDTDNELTQGKEKRSAKQEKQLDELMKKIDLLKSRTDIYASKGKTQGSSQPIGDGRIIDDELYNAEAGLDLLKVKELIASYKDGKKNIRQVSDEFRQFGYITETQTKKGNEIKIKPSLQRYTNDLSAKLMDPKTASNLLNEKTTRSGGATLQALANFVDSRLKKTHTRYVSKAQGSEIDAVISSKLVSEIEPENKAMQETINKLRSIINGLAPTEDNGLTQETINKYNDKLDSMQKALDSANKAINDHKASLNKTYDEVLGVQVDMIDPEFGSELGGIYSGATMGSTENIGERIIDLIIVNKGKKTEEQVLATKRYYLLSKGAKNTWKADSKEQKNYEAMLVKYRIGNGNRADLNARNAEPDTTSTKKKYVDGRATGADETYADSTGRSPGYKPDGDKTAMPTTTPKTTITPKETSEIDTIISEINDMANTTDADLERNMNDALVRIQEVFFGLTKMDAEQEVKFTGAVKNVIKNMNRSIDLDIKSIESAFSVYKDTKNAKLREQKLNKFSELMKSIVAKIKKFLGYAQKNIIDKNMKEKVVGDLNDILTALGSESNGDIFNMIDSKIKMNKSLIDFSGRLKMEAKDGKLQIDSKSKKSITQMEKIKFDEFYQKIVKEYKIFKRGKPDGKAKDANILKKAWRRIKDNDNFKDVYSDMPPAEQVKQAIADINAEENIELESEKYKEDTPEDIAEIERQIEFGVNDSGTQVDNETRKDMKSFADEETDGKTKTEIIQERTDTIDDIIQKVDKIRNKEC